MSTTILGIAGSLRRHSCNRAALRAARTLAPSDVRIDEFDLDGIPVHSQDGETEPPKRTKKSRSRFGRLGGWDCVM